MDEDLGLTGLGEANGRSSAAAAAMTEELRRLKGEMRETNREAASLAGAISGSLRNAFDRLVTGGAKASDVLRALGRDLVGKTFDAAVAPIQKAVTSGITGLIGKGLVGLLGSVSLFAEGGVLSGGRVRAFAKGGVVDAPTLFGMRGGLGLMGEAGPEAILPLKRGPDGSLGVAAGGGGGARVTVNIATPDVAGFAKSRSQIAAQVARAVQIGARRR